MVPPPNSSTGRLLEELEVHSQAAKERIKTDVCVDCAWDPS